MFIRTLNTKLKKIRGIGQIIMTLISFIGFNEAVLAARYRNSLYTNNLDTRMTVAQVYPSEPVWPCHAGSGLFSRQYLMPGDRL